MRFSTFALSVSLAACSHAASVNGPVAVDNFGSFNNASVSITAEGGIAALSITHRVSHDDRAFVYSQRHLCAQNCGAPMDSASGTLSPAVTDSLFNIVLAQSPFSLKDDYGTTGQAADMMVYTMTVRAEGQTKTIRADDGTMPPPMRQIVSSVRAVIADARN
jgi:emfourin